MHLCGLANDPWSWFSTTNQSSLVPSHVPCTNPCDAVGRASKVWSLVKSQDTTACRGARHMKLFGKPVRNRGILKLLGLGKTRFQKLRSAHANGDEHCPFDMRCVPKEPKAPTHARELVYDFLMTLYTETAEPIPDGLNSNKRPRQGAHKFDGKTMDRSKMKHLPHGSIMDYFRQCQSNHRGVKIGRKLFSSATCYRLSNSLMCLDHVCNCAN